MCTVLGVARSTYYKSFDKTKSAKELENEELKSAIKRIYKENKGIYGAPRIHYILGIEGFNVSLKRVQRRMSELGLYAITVKKYKPHSSKKGCPYDNACIESFHSSIKKEEIYRNTYRTFEEANMAVFKYIEGWYNRKRLHSSINYMTPDQCELLARSAA